MAEEVGPTIKIDELKVRLADYVEKEFPGTLSREEVFEGAELALSMIRAAKADFLDKFLVNWRGCELLMLLQFRIASKLGGLDHFIPVGEKLIKDRYLIFGEELTRAADESAQNGEYHEWYFNVRYRMYRNGVWPIPRR